MLCVTFGCYNVGLCTSSCVRDDPSVHLVIYNARLGHLRQLVSPCVYRLATSKHGESKLCLGRQQHARVASTFREGAALMRRAFPRRSKTLKR